MIAYVTVGADDIARAKRFYSAVLPALDYGLKEGPEGLSYALPEQPGQSAALPDFYVKPTFDGHPASAGNGAMIALDAITEQGIKIKDGLAYPSEVPGLGIDWDWTAITKMALMSETIDGNS